MGQKAGSLYRIKNKKNTKYLTGWGHTIKLVWSEEEPGNRQSPELAWSLGTGWLAGLHVLLSRASTEIDTQVIYVLVS